MAANNVTRAVVIPPTIDERLRKLAEETGLPVSYIARKALWLALRQQDRKWLMEVEHE